MAIFVLLFTNKGGKSKTPSNGARFARSLKYKIRLFWFVLCDQRVGSILHRNSFQASKNRGGCRSQRQQQRCLLPKVITLSASQPSSSKKPYFFALSQRIRRCITRVSRLFLRNQYNCSLERKSLYFGLKYMATSKVVALGLFDVSS